MAGLHASLRRYAPAFLLVTSSFALLGIDCGKGKDCVVDGKTWHDGDKFPSPDGCNTCTCQDGAAACTAIGCAAKWYRSCGDPVCMGHTVDPNVPACTTQKVGEVCGTVGERCDPNDSCNVRLVCATSDPTQQTGGCPISLARYKRDIHYLTPGERERLRDDLVRTPLATWRYKSGGADAPARLGFIIDDVAPSPSVSPSGETVDLYGYTSMAVAAVQVQAEEIAALKREIAELRQKLDARSTRRK